MLDWLIIGGGIHGTYLSLALIARAGVPRNRLRVLDPAPTPLARWHQMTANTGMDSLRSPGVHHLDLDPRALFQFAKTPVGRQCRPPKGVYGRPPLDLFRTHTDAVIDQHQLGALRLTGRACGLERIDGGWRVETDTGSLESRRVLLAISASEQPNWPDWAGALRQAGAPIQHIFAPEFDCADLPAWRHAVVIGGGITAVQTALALAQRAPGTVTLVQRHPLRQAAFDSDPCWMGPKCLRSYHAEPSPVKRRAQIRAARQRGSVPDYVAYRFKQVRKRDALTQCVDEVTQATLDQAGQVRLVLAGGATLHSDCVILATGFAPHRPGGAWLDQAVATYNLPCAPCGYPLVDTTLCWAPGLYATGALAELELGPVARNIIGARRAAERLGAPVP